MDEASYENFGFHGYKASNTFGEFIIIFSNGPKNKYGLSTSLLQMSGRACRDFEIRGGDWIKLFRYLYTINYNPTRLDIAIDDYEGKYFDIDKLRTKLKNEEYVSPMRTFESDEKYAKGGVCKKNQLYIGSLQSATMINIYDKNAERHSKGEDTWVDTWTRIEMRFKQKKAITIINQLVNYGFKDFSVYTKRLLYTLLDFKTDTGELRIRDRDTIQWWKRFLGSVEKIKIKNQGKNESSIIIKKDWIKRAVSRSLLQIFLASKKNFIPYLKEIMVDISSEMSKKDLAIINKELLRNNEQELTSHKFRQTLELLETVFDRNSNPDIYVLEDL